MDHALRLPGLSHAPPAAPAAAAVAVSPAPRPRRPGPVLMGDLTGSLAGRPLLLLLWDEPAARTPAARTAGARRPPAPPPAD